MRAWAARCAPLLAARLRAVRHGRAGTTWHVDETYLRVDGRWCYRYRAIDRDGNLVEARLSEQRDMAAAQRFVAEALAVVGRAPTLVTTEGHDAYPRAIREALGAAVGHRTSRYNNNRSEQDYRGVQQRFYPMRGCGSFAVAARCCAGLAEQRQYFRPRTRRDERVTVAEQRLRFQASWAALLTELAAV